MVICYQSVFKVFFLVLAFNGVGLHAQQTFDRLIEVREAVDRRDASSPVLGTAVARGDYDALRLWGLIGTDACAAIRPFIKADADEAKIAALAGLAHCRDEAAFPEIFDIARTNSAPAVRMAALQSLAFTTAEANRPALAGLVSNLLGDTQADTGTLEKAAAVNSLMQSLTYAALTPKDLPGLEIQRVLDAAGRADALGMEAAYLLSRLQGLADTYTLSQVINVLDGDIPEAQKFFLTRVLAQFGNAASPVLLRLAEGKSDAVAMGALRAMAQLSDQGSLAHLTATVSHAKPAYRQLALASLASRALDDQSVTATIIELTADDNAWIAVTALRGLMTRAPDAAMPIARNWLAGDNYYRAFAAMGLLAGTDRGKMILSGYAAAYEGTIRGREAAIALDPSIEATEKPRQAPSAGLRRSYAGRELVLETTRGTICIAPLAQAPFTAANFMLLADSGKLDGMLWHRVIPNFVAQAGQSEDFSLASWGTIREEWGASSHTPGTVGLATAGRDTGSTQFFINTAHNLHLDGRYTVFARVVGGLDVAYALQEGDLIEKASTVPAPGSACP